MPSNTPFGLPGMVQSALRHPERLHRAGEWVALRIMPFGIVRGHQTVAFDLLDDQLDEMPGDMARAHDGPSHSRVTGYSSNVGSLLTMGTSSAIAWAISSRSNGSRWCQGSPA